MALRKKGKHREEAERIVRAAAKVRENIYDAKSYPTNEDIANVNQGKKWIPHYLQTFWDYYLI